MKKYYVTTSIDKTRPRVGLTALADAHPNVHLTHVFSRLPEGDPTPGLRGHIDAGLLTAYLRAHPGGADAHLYVCGPDAMIEGTVAALRGLGVPDDRIHQEYFAAVATVVAPATVSLTAYLDGEEVTTTTDEKTLVTDALERAGALPPTTCRSGTCSTCVAEVIEGRATMLENRGLGAADVAAGLVLTCQAVATAPRLVVDYDVAN